MGLKNARSSRTLELCVKWIFYHKLCWDLSSCVVLTTLGQTPCFVSCPALCSESSSKAAPQSQILPLITVYKSVLLFSLVFFLISWLLYARNSLADATRVIRANINSQWWGCRANNNYPAQQIEKGSGKLINLTFSSSLHLGKKGSKKKLRAIMVYTIFTAVLETLRAVGCLLHNLIFLVNFWVCCNQW